jgi:hypothetical protein
MFTTPFTKPLNTAIAYRESRSAAGITDRQLLNRLPVLCKGARAKRYASRFKGLERVRCPSSVERYTPYLALGVQNTTVE